MVKTYNIGRDFDEPIKIDPNSKSVSHKHATITVDGEKWILQDTASTNGTYIEQNGKFQRCGRVKISPDTWIRLGEEGHRGYYFKARRVLKPNDYREDFEELKDIYQEWETAKRALDDKRRLAKYLTIPLILIGFIFSFLPFVGNNPSILRATIVLPGIISPFIQDILLRPLEKKVKSLQSKLICPKCRRTLSKDDILSRSHSYCKAY